MSAASQRLFLTGASGFLGARVAETLHGKGHQLALLMRDPDSAWRIKELMSHVDVIQGDINDAASYRDALNNFRPDGLVHLAWGGVSGATRNAPSQVHNISASTDLLQTAIAAGVQYYIGLGSQAEYGAQNRRLDENAPTKPTTLYGQSKLATCHLSRLMCADASVRFAWVRLFSAYGPRDKEDWVIPSIILKLAAGQKLSLTAGEQLWDFIFIDDAANAIAAIAETPAAEGCFNLGSGSATPLRQTITALRDMINPGAELGFGEIPYRPDQVMHLEADITRLTEKTCWRPANDMKAGLKKTVDWFTNNARD